MAAETPTHESEKLIAGTTWKWEKTLSDYPASDWSLNYYLRRNGATETSFGSTADGDTFQVNIAAGVTALFTPDVYDICAALVSK